MDHDDPIIVGAPDDLVDDPDRYELTGLAGAGWAMHSLARARATIDRLVAQRDASLQQIDAWFRDVGAGPARAASMAEGLLTQFALHARRTEGVKTIRTPWGEVTTRGKDNDTTIEYDGDAALVTLLGQRVALITAADAAIELTVNEILASLRAAGLRLRFKVELDAVAYRSSLAPGPDGTVVDTVTGEVVTGARVVPKPLSVTVKPGTLASTVPALPPVELRERPEHGPHPTPDPDRLVAEFINDRAGDVTQAGIDAFIAEVAASPQEADANGTRFPDADDPAVTGDHHPFG